MVLHVLSLLYSNIKHGPRPSFFSKFKARSIKLYCLQTSGLLKQNSSFLRSFLLGFSVAPNFLSFLLAHARSRHEGKKHEISFILSSKSKSLHLFFFQCSFLSVAMSLSWTTSYNSVTTIFTHVCPRKHCN